MTRRADSIPHADTTKADQFIRFRDNIGRYLSHLELEKDGESVPEIAQQAADATYFFAIVEFTRVLQKAAASWLTWQNTICDGGRLPAAPSVPFLPKDFPSMPLPGIFSRYRTLADRVRNHPGYTYEIGRTLGVDGLGLSTLSLPEH